MTEGRDPPEDPSRSGAGRAPDAAAGDASNIPNEIDGINTDGRLPRDWESKYDRDAIFHIRVDATYIGILLIGTLAILFLTWGGFTFELLAKCCATCTKSTFLKYSYFF